MDDTGSQTKSTLTVDDRFSDGIRIDTYLARTSPEHSRAFFQKCLTEHRILINGRHPKHADNVCTGDVIDVFWPLRPTAKLEPEPIPLDIMAEDRDVIVLNKPPGLVVHPAHGNTSGTLVHGLLFHDGAAFAEMADEEQRPGIVHRLDKDTSGAMVIAKNPLARLFLKDAFKRRLVEKTYLAIVLGAFDVPSGRIETDLGRHPVNRQRMAVVERGGKHAVTLFSVLGQSHGCALLEVRILTGRTHQIRVHCAYLNHPVLGDPLYGGRPRNAPLQPPRQMLHAWKIVFPHPHSKIMRQHMAPLPDDFRAALAALELPLIGEHQPPQDPLLDPETTPATRLTEAPVDLKDDEDDDSTDQDDDLNQPDDNDGWPEDDGLRLNHDGEDHDDDEEDQ